MFAASCIDKPSNTMGHSEQTNPSPNPIIHVKCKGKALKYSRVSPGARAAAANLNNPYDVSAKINRSMSHSRFGFLLQSSLLITLCASTKVVDLASSKSLVAKLIPSIIIMSSNPAKREIVIIGSPPAKHTSVNLGDFG